MLANLASTVVKVGEAAAVAGAIVAGVSVKMAADFQASTTRLQTQAHMSAQSVDEVRQGLLKMATEVGKSPTELSDGFYHIASALTQLPPQLRNVNDELTIYKNAVELSKIGNASLEDSTQAVVGVLAAFGKEGMTAAQAAAELNAIVGAGDMRMQQLTAAMATGILPAASTFGLKLKDVGAALATLTDNVTPADEAATRLRMTFSLLGAPSHQAQKALGAIGINATQLGYDMRQPNGLLVALGDLRSHLSHIDVSQLQGGLESAKDDLAHFGFTAAQVDQMVGKLGPDATEQAVILSKAFGGGRTSAAIMTLLTEFDAFKEKYGAIDEGSKKFGEDWQATLNTFTSQVDRLKASAEVLGIRLGDTLLPALTNVVRFLADNMGVVMGWADALGHMGSGLEGFLRSFGIGAAAPPSQQVAAQKFRAGERTETGGAGIARSPGEMFRQGERGEMGSSGVTNEMASAAAGKQAAEMAKRIAQALADAFKDAVRSIDWAGLGREVARDALAFIGAFLDNLGWAGEVTRYLIGAFIALKVAMAVGWVLQFGAAFRVVAGEEGLLVAVTRALGVEYIATGARAVAAAFRATVAWMSARVTTAAIASMYAWDWVVANARVVAAFIATRVAAIGSAIQTAAVWTASQAAMVLSTLRTVGAMILLNTWAGIVRVATLVWTGAQWLLNVALSANPIGLVIIAIALLVAGIIWAYNNVGWFRAAVNEAWLLLQQVGGWIKEVLWPIIVSLGDKFAETAGRMVESAKFLGGALIEHIGNGLNSAIGLFRGFIEAINGILGHFGIEGIKVEGTLKTGIDVGAVKKAVGLATGGMITNGPYIVGEGDQCIAEGTLIATERGDKPIETIRPGERVWTRKGLKSVLWGGPTRRNATVLRVSANGRHLTCTPDHRLWASSRLSVLPLSPSRVLSAAGVPDRIRESMTFSAEAPWAAALSGPYKRVRSVIGMSLRAGGTLVESHDILYGKQCGLCPSRTADAKVGPEPHQDLADSRCSGHVPAPHGLAPIPSLASLDRPNGTATDGASKATYDVLVGHAQVQGYGTAVAPVLEGDRAFTLKEAGSPRDLSATLVLHREAPSSGVGGRAVSAAPSPFMGGHFHSTPAWVESQNLAPGDLVWLFDAKRHEFTPFSIDRISHAANIDTYDLAVEDAHEFVAAGLLVHNSHPEYVIPTDPRYRSRAKGLLQGAIQAIGLAEGGTIPTSGSDGECVEFVEAQTGVHYAVSAAKEMVRYINSDVGKAGELAVFTAGPYGHVALLTGDESGGSFPVVDSNWVGHHEIGTHVMNRGMYGFAGFIDTGHPLGTLAGGGGGVGFNPLGLIDGAVKAAQGALNNVPEWIRGLTGAVLGKMVDGVKGKLASSFAGHLTGASGDSASHADWLHTAEKIAGVGPDWDQGLSVIIGHESSWNPGAANLNDVNAQAGNASRGLMQLTGSNRARYDPDESPVGQIVGGIKYILSRYGGIGNVPGVRSVLSGGGYVPYDSGGLLPPGLTLAYNGTGRHEVVSPAGAGGMADLVAEQRRTNALLHAILHDQNAPAGGYAANLRAG